MILFIRRVTDLTSRAWRIFCDIFFGILVAWFFLSLFLNIFPCSPVSTRFSFVAQGQHPDYKCLNQTANIVAFSMIHAITDVILFCAPIYIVCKVRMPLGRKIRVVLAFALGAVCVSASIVRATLAFGPAGTGLDVTWTAVQAVCWTIVDITFSAVVVSLPALNAAFEDALARLMGSQWWTSSRGGSQTAGKTSFGDSSERQASDGVRSNEPLSPLTQKHSGRSSSSEREKDYDDLV